MGIAFARLNFAHAESPLAMDNENGKVTARIRTNLIFGIWHIIKLITKAVKNHFITVIQHQSQDYHTVSLQPLDSLKIKNLRTSTAHQQKKGALDNLNHPLKATIETDWANLSSQTTSVRSCMTSSQSLLSSDPTGL